MSLNWRDAYNRIHPDLPKEELRKLIEEVEGGVFVRAQELQKVTDSHGEFKEMVEAMKEVRRLQIEKLNFPDFNPGLKYDFKV